MRPVTMLVCGDRLRGDDGSAAAVVAALPAVVRHLGTVRDVGGLMPDDLLGATGPVIVVDAVHGLPAGSVVDVPLESLSEIAAAGASPGSSHALPLPAVLAIAQRLGALPEGRFIGIAGDAFALGDGLSVAVRASIDPAADRLAHWVRVLAHGRRPAACA